MHYKQSLPFCLCLFVFCHIASAQIVPLTIVPCPGVVPLGSILSLTASGPNGDPVFDPGILIWSSNKPNQLKFDDPTTGNLSTLFPGTYEITATATDVNAKDYIGHCDITVRAPAKDPPPEDLKSVFQQADGPNKVKAVGIYVIAGKTEVRTVTSSIKWTVDKSSSDIAEINAITGILTPRQAGKVVVNAEYTGSGPASGKPIPPLTITVAAPIATTEALITINDITVPMKAATKTIAVAFATDAGSTVPAPVTTGIGWSIAPIDGGGTATINATTGEISPTKAGKVNYVATRAGKASKPATITITQTPTKPQFDGIPKSGNPYIDVIGAKGDVLSVYQMDGILAPSVGATCSAVDLSKATVLQITSSTATASTTTLPNDGTNRITINQPLVAGTGLCLKSGNSVVAADVQLSDYAAVQDMDEHGRVRTFLTLGVQITNQQSSTSSTAGEYLQAGFALSLLKATSHISFKDRVAYGYTAAEKPVRWHPGIQTVLDVRLSPIPVSASATSTTGASTTTTTTGGTTTTTTTPVTVTSLNLLSSQQSARVRGQIYFPTKLTSWQKGDNVFTLAPIAKAGFATLLNPSVSNRGTAGSTTSTLTATTADFSPAYSFFGDGGRLAWDQYPRDPDKAPIIVTQFDVALSKFSNLPSYLCTNNPANTLASGIKGLTVGSNTACGSGTSASLYYNLPYLTHACI